MLKKTWRVLTLLWNHAGCGLDRDPAYGRCLAVTFAEICILRVWFAARLFHLWRWTSRALPDPPFRCLVTAGRQERRAGGDGHVPTADVDGGWLHTVMLASRGAESGTEVVRQDRSDQERENKY